MKSKNHYIEDCSNDEDSDLNVINYDILWSNLVMETMNIYRVSENTNETSKSRACL